jgi:hypothetical protein
MSVRTGVVTGIEPMVVMSSDSNADAGIQPNPRPRFHPVTDSRLRYPECEDLLPRYHAELPAGQPGDAKVGAFCLQKNSSGVPNRKKKARITANAKGIAAGLRPLGLIGGLGGVRRRGVTATM